MGWAGAIPGRSPRWYRQLGIGVLGRHAQARGGVTNRAIVGPGMGPAPAGLAPRAADVHPSPHRRDAH